MAYGFISRGNGYADDKSFEPYTVLREPLPEREQRVFARPSGNRTCYGAYSFKLAELSRETTTKNYTSGLFILISHGSGTEVLAIKGIYDAGEFRAALLAMPDQVLYSTLWAIYATANEVRTDVGKETRDKYAKAFVEGRLKKSRVKQGVRKVYIEDPPQAAGAH